MKRREAKREACFRSALVLESSLGCGWLLDEPDERIAEGVQEIIDELHRRGRAAHTEGEEHE